MKERRRSPRRKSERVEDPLPTPVFWRGKDERHSAYIYDVGKGGCFLNTNADAENGDRVTVEIPDLTEKGKSLDFAGVVINQPRRLKGFSVKFDDLSEDNESLLKGFLQNSKETLDWRK